MRYGFLGPETTFTHQALLQALAEGPAGAADAEVEIVPFASVATATADLIAGDIDALMAPIENSVEGGVSGTLDVLAATDAITIVAEQIVQISFVLAAKEPTALEDLTVVSSHPHAQAQVQGWLRAHVPGADVAASSSTAAAARDLAAMDPDRAYGRAAVCSELAARHFGLEILAEGIEDVPGARTRFVLVAREGRIPARTGADKTTVVIHLPHNRSGALLEALEMLRSNGVNMSRIESRPMGTSWAGTPSPSTSRATWRTVASPRPCAPCTGCARWCTTWAPTRGWTACVRRCGRTSRTSPTTRRTAGSRTWDG